MQSSAIIRKNLEASLVAVVDPAQRDDPSIKQLLGEAVNGINVSSFASWSTSGKTTATNNALTELKERLAKKGIKIASDANDKSVAAHLGRLGQLYSARHAGPNG